jgi:hypothetical protein
MSRYCDGKVSFLGRNRGVVNVWEEGGAVNVAILAAILSTLLSEN